MTTSSVQSIMAATTITGNRITMTGNTITAPHTAGNTSGQPISTVKMTLMAVGALHGIVRVPFADPETLEDAIQPAELATARVKCAQGGAGAAFALVEEVLFLN